MRVIIAGSRGIRDLTVVKRALEIAATKGIVPTSVVSGGAYGVDRLGEAWARAQKLPIGRFLADWHRYGAFAGPERNGRMVRCADALIAVWDGRSAGTADVIRQATAAELHVYVHRHEDALIPSPSRRVGL